MCPNGNSEAITNCVPSDYLVLFLFFFYVTHSLIMLSFFFCIYAVPPTSVEIVDHVVGSKIMSREGEEVILQCLVRNAKPAAEIVWFKRNVEIKSGKYRLLGVRRRRQRRPGAAIDLSVTLTRVCLARC